MKLDYNNEMGRVGSVVIDYVMVVDERMIRKGEGFRTLTKRDASTARNNDEPNVNERRFR